MEHKKSRTPARLRPTAEVIEMLDRVVTTEGPVVLYQTATSETGDGPVCMPESEIAIHQADVYLGSLRLQDSQVPVYVEAEAFATWWNQELEIDIDLTDRGTAGSGGVDGSSMVVRPRTFSEGEIYLLVAEGPPLRGKHH